MKEWKSNTSGFLSPIVQLSTVKNKTMMLLRTEYETIGTGYETTIKNISNNRLCSCSLANQNHLHVISHLQHHLPPTYIKAKCSSERAFLCFLSSVGWDLELFCVPKETDHGHLLRKKYKKFKTFTSKQGNVCIYVKYRRDDLMERSPISVSTLSQLLILFAESGQFHCSP